MRSLLLTVSEKVPASTYQRPVPVVACGQPTQTPRIDAMPWVTTQFGTSANWRFSSFAGLVTVPAEQWGAAVVRLANVLRRCVLSHAYCKLSAYLGTGLACALQSRQALSVPSVWTREHTGTFRVQVNSLMI